MQPRQDRIFVSTACLAGDKSHRRVIDSLRQIGIKQIELTGVHPHLPNDALVALVSEYQAQGIKFTFHNYFPPPPDSIVLNLLSKDAVQHEQSKQLISNAMHLSLKTSVFLYAFHPGYYRNGKALPNGYFEFDKSERKLEPKEGMERFKQEFSALYRAFETDRKAQRNFVAVENLFPSPDGENDSFMCTYAEIEELIGSEEFRNTDLGLLIDLGHLTLAANHLGFDRDKELQKIISRFGDRIYEVHLSENDGKEDLHWRLKPDSWQLNALKYFKDTGSRSGGTIFCIESRGMTLEQIQSDYEMVRKTLV